MSAAASLTAGRGTRAKGIALILAKILPVIVIVSLLPVIPKLFAEFGALPNAGFLLPAIVTIPSLVFAIFWPVAGGISDRYRRRQSFVGSRELILASRALLGIAEAFAITISSALIEDYFGEDCHHSTAWVGVSTSIAATALIAVGGALADVSWSGPFAIHIAAIPALIMAILVIEEPHTSAKPVGTSAKPVGFPWRAAQLIIQDLEQD